jgi:sugar O-acyltransferase (sialic acid O-acetyltransferase NeuD family)
VNDVERRGLAGRGSAERIYIVGAGGFGREVYSWFGRSALLARLVGFLSADRGAHDGVSVGHGVVGSPDDHDVRPGDAFVLAIGIPGVRRNVAESLQSRGANFLTLIHHTAMVAESATIHEGAIICPYALVSAHARVGACVILNYHSSAAHDAVIGDYTVLSPYAAVGGNAVLEDDVFVGLHGTVGPGKRVGARSKVAASSCALLNVPPDCLALGVPARITPLLYR